MQKIINAHCHKNCITQCVVGAVVNATNESNWDAVIKQQGDNTWSAIGIHPWFADTVVDGWNVRLYKKLVDNPRVMIGEIGLDTTRSDINIQTQVFITQMRMGAELNRVTHIHCVHAWDKMLHILKHYPHSKTIVFHGFNGNSEIISQIGDRAYYSYGVSVLNNAKIADSVAVTPNTQILVESDDTAPTILPDIIKRISEIKHIPFEKMSDIIFENTQRMLNTWTDCIAQDC